MATHRIPILGANTNPDPAGTNPPFFEPYGIKATNDAWQHLNCIFNDTATKDKLFGLLNVPKNYVGTAKIIVVWSSTATSGNVVWEFAYRSVGGNDTTSLDQSGVEETATATDAAPGAANRRLEVEIALTSANLAADETIEFYLARDGSSGSDTMAAAAALFQLFFEYSDV